MVRDNAVRIQAAEVTLDADVTMPGSARGVVVFAHGTGSSRHSKRNRMVADRLTGVGLATVLMDLLTADEERYDRATGALRFNIGMLAERVMSVIDWLQEQPQMARLPLGLFGASSGAAAALVAAADRPAAVRAVVSRGGRPDLAGDVLNRVYAPTLLIVGGRDERLIPLNHQAATMLAGEHTVQIVPGATHLFEEPGALEQVAGWAAEWFDHHLAGGDLTLDGYLPEIDGRVAPDATHDA